MPSQKNIDQVTNLKAQLANAKAVVLADYSGLSVSGQTDLRLKLKEAGGNFIVTKNTLFRLALKDDHEQVIEELDSSLSGTTAFLFALEDEIGPLKALVEFAKEKDLPKVKIGLMLKPSDRVLTLDELTELSKLQSKNDLIAKLIGTIKSPTYGLVTVLSGNMRKLVYLLSEVKKSKETN